MTKKSFSDYGIEVSGSGPEVYTTCPQCSPTRKKKRAKCLSVNLEKECWICHHCGWAGGLATGADKWRGDASWNKPTYVKPAQRPRITLPDQMLEWLYARGITSEVVERNQISCGMAYMPQLEDEAPCIIFPYFRNGELINRKYRTIGDKNFRLETRCERILYGLDDIDVERVYWVEGEMDKLACEVAGFKSVVSVPDGAPEPKSKEYSSKFSFLDADWEKIESVKQHVIAVDSDDAGKRLETELIRRLGIEKCSRVPWPEGRKDANDVLKDYGVDDLRWRLENPEPYPIEGVVEVADKRAEVLWLYRNGFTKGVSTGWPTLDAFYSVRPGLMTVVTGIPSSGKSNWIDCLCVNLAREFDWSVGVFSPENLPVEQHMAAIAEKYMLLPFGEGPSTRMTEGMLQDSLDWVGAHFKWILPNDESAWEIENILKIAGQLCLRYGIRGLVLDPWNELEALRPAAMSETEYISQALKRIRVFARMRSIHVWVVIHPQKLYRDKDGKYPIPTLYDCAGSAHWRNKADNGIVVWRDFSQDDAPQVEIHVQKIRFRIDGKPGKANLFYEPICATYGEYGRTTETERTPAPEPEQEQPEFV